MVRLVLSASRGNHARSFCHSGYLGLTPVTVQGSLRLEVEEDNQLLDASSIEIRIRCYESEARSAAPGSKPKSVKTLYEVSETLWHVAQAYPNQKRLWGPVGNFQRDWRLVVPVDAASHGALSTMSFKSWRVWWAVEGVVYHKPSGIYGSRLLKSFPVNLVQYSSSFQSTRLDWDNSALPASSSLKCTASTSQSIYGPTEAFQVHLHISQPVTQTNLSLRKISVELRRESILTSNSPSDSSSRTPEHASILPTPDCYPEFYPPALRIPTDSMSPTEYKFSSKNPDYLNKAKEPDFSYFSMDTAHHPSSTSGSIRKEDVSLLHVTKREDLDFQDDHWQGTFASSLPKPNSLHHYSIGETCTTGGMQLRFYILVKISCRSANGRIDLELPPQDIVLVSHSAEDVDHLKERIPKILRYQAGELDAMNRGTFRRANSVDFSPTMGNEGELLELSQNVAPTKRRQSCIAEICLDTKRASATTSLPTQQKLFCKNATPWIPRRASNVYLEDSESDEVQPDHLSASNFLLESRRASTMSTCSSTGLNNSQTIPARDIAPRSPSMSFSAFTLKPASSSPQGSQNQQQSNYHELSPREVERKSKRRHQQFSTGSERGIDPLSCDPNRIGGVPLGKVPSANGSFMSLESKFALGRRRKSLFG